MAKVFLSHKSEDKVYVEKVVSLIGRNNCVYDKFTFEAGMKTIDEIMKGLDESDLFVIFLSDKALDSPWVKMEMRKSKELLDAHRIIQIYPIIIDQNIQYNDSRIPSWMQKAYNIRPILSPKIASQKIRARLAEISWQKISKIQQKNTFFFGRNKEIDEFETRYTDYDEPPLKCVIASSAFNGIGRKKYMEYCYKKVDLMRQSYHYQLIDMGRDESVEDFILKIADLGYKDLTPIEVNTMSETQKIEVAVSIINQIQELGEFLFINDSGSIVKPNQSLAKWFIAIINKINESLSLGIAAKYKVRKNTYDVQDPIFNIMITELFPKDRRGMLKKYCEIEDISIDTATLKDISNVLIGFPEQIFFSVKMLKDEGIPFTREHLNEIREFGNDKAATVVETLRQENEDAIDFLAVLSEFELIDYELLNSFITINPNYRGYFDLFLSMSVIEFVGSDREYFRINDVLQDYLSRRRLADKETTEKFLKLITPNIIDANFINNAGLAKYYSSIKTNIEQADDKYIIPSVYLKAIMAAYNEKDYNKVIRIVINRLIESKALDRFDNELITRIYYYLCLSLAREGDTRFYNYINYNGFEKEDQLFLLGFYNRLNGDPAKAISYLKQALGVRYKYPRAKRELVNAYLLIDDYESAYLYSKDNYYDDKTNPFLIQAYFKSLIHLKSDSSTNEEIKGIVDTALKKPTSPFEKQVKAEISAWNELKFQNNAKEAISIINRAIDDDNDNLYLYLTKIDICEEANNITEMEQAITKLRAIVRSHKRFTNALYIREARLAKAQKRDAEYIRNILAKIKNVPSSVKDRWERQLLS